MLRRRRIVQSLASGLLALAGCTTSEEDGNPTESNRTGTTRSAETATRVRAETTETTARASTTSEAPATGSQASVNDLVVYNWTNEKHRVELVVTPVADSSNRFTDEFTLGPRSDEDNDDGDDSDSKAYPDVEQMDEKCRVEVTVDGERSATGDWDGDVNDYAGLRIYIEYGEIDFSRKIV